MRTFKKDSKEQLSDNLGVVLEEGFNSGIKIVSSDGIEFPVHKLILKAQCPVFSCMFNSDFSENADGVVKITDISGKTMKILLTYCYTGELLPIWKDGDTIVEFIYAAGKYQMTQVLKLLDGMSGSDSRNEVDVDATDIDVQVLDVAGKLGLKNAERRLLEQVIAKIRKVTKSDELFELFGFEKDAICKKVEEKVDASTILNVLDYVFGNMEHEEFLNSNKLIILAYAQREGSLKSVESELLKRFAQRVNTAISSEDLFKIIGKF